MTLLLAELFAFLTIGALSYSVYQVLFTIDIEEKKLKRVKSMLSGSSKTDEGSMSDYFKRYAQSLVDKFVDSFVKTDTKKSVSNDLYLAGKRHKNAVNEFYLERFTFSILFFGLGVFLKTDPSMLFLLAFVGFMVPKLNLDSKRKSRQRRIKTAFPLALDMIVISLEAGYNIQRAMEIVIRDLEKISGKKNNVMVEELNVLANELQLGLDSKTAWNNLYRRTRIEETKQLIAAVLQSEKLGSTLASTLRGLTLFLQKSRAQELEKEAAALGAMMTLPLAVCILPVVLAFVAGPFIVELMNNQIF